MSSSTLKPVAYRMPPVAGADRSLSKVSKVTMMNRQTPAPLQVKAKESLSATSRREMLHLTAASVGLLSLLLPGPAEAVAKDTPLSTVMKLLEELRQNVGLAEPKDEGEDTKPKDEMYGKSKVQNNTKEAVPKPKDVSEAKPKVENSVKESKPEAKDEKKHTSIAQELKVAPSEGAAIPALPGIINGKTVEATFP